MHLIFLEGHINFSDEVTSSMRISDGIVLFIDAAEGVSHFFDFFFFFVLLPTLNRLDTQKPPVLPVM